MRHQLAAGGGREAVHHGDHRLRQRTSFCIIALHDEEAPRPRPANMSAHLLQVVAGAEGAAGAGDHHHAHRFVGGEGDRAACNAAQERRERAR
jgi:hypothetical protein